MGRSVKHGKKVSFLRVLSYFMAFLTAFGIVLLFIYSVDRVVLGKQYEEKIQRNLSVITRNIEGQMQILQNLGSDFFLEPDVIMYLKPDREESLSVKAEKWRIIRKISMEEALAAPITSSVFAFIPGEKHILTGEGEYEDSYFFANICTYEKYPEQFWMEKFTGHQHHLILGPTVMRTRKRSLLVIPVVASTRLSGHVVVHVCNIAAGTLESLFVAEPSFNSMRFIVRNKSGQVLLDTAPAAGSVQTSLASDANIVFSCSSYRLGWDFYTVVAKKDYRRVVSGNLVLIIQIVFIALFCGVCMTVLFSLGIYRPVQNQYLAHESTNARDYICHSVQLLLHGIQPSDIGLLSDQMRAYCGFSGTQFICCVILLDYNLHFYQTYGDSGAGEARQRFFDRMVDAVSCSFSCYASDLRNGLYSFILNTDSPDLRKRVSSFFSTNHLFADADCSFFSVTVGIGTMCDAYGKVPLSHKQALIALQRRNADCKYEVIEFERVPVRDRVLFSFYDQKEISSNISSGDENALVMSIVRVLEINLKRGISNENRKELCRQICMVGQRCLEENGYTLERLESYTQVKDTLLQQELDISFDVIKRHMIDFFVEIQKLVYQTPAVTADIRFTAGLAQKFIDTHFSKPMCLEIVAEELHITPKYLSRVFKTAFGENFTDYTSRIRIEKAKLLLITTDQRIADIAVQVGIESRATFLRVFKKITGISPTEYREFGKLSEQEDLLPEYTQGGM